MKYNKTVEKTYCSSHSRRRSIRFFFIFMFEKQKHINTINSWNFLRVLPHLKCLHTFNISHKCRHSQLKHKHHLTRHLEISGRLKCLLQRGTMSSYGLMNSLVAVVQTHCYSLSEGSVTVLRCSTG